MGEVLFIMRSPFILILAFSLIPFYSIAHAQDRYDNPADGRSYFTEGKFKSYAPKELRNTTGMKVVTNGVRLLTGEPDLQQRVQVKNLATFIKNAEEKAYEILGKNESAALVLLQFDCQPKKHDVKIASQGEPKEALLQTLYDTMMRLEPLKTSGEIKFQLELQVRP